MAVVAEYNISDLVRSPSTVIEQAERGEVILHRRGKADLKLMLANMETDSSMLNEALARVVVVLLEKDVGGEAARGAMASVYPWLRFLPEEAQQECIQDLIETALSCVSIRNFAAFQGKVASWRSTAEIYSDPVLYAKLSGPIEVLEDHGQVPIPGAP